MQFKYRLVSTFFFPHESTNRLQDVAQKRINTVLIRNCFSWRLALMEREERGHPPEEKDEEACYGSSNIDDIASIPIAFFCFVLIVWIAYSSKKNLKSIKHQDTLLKWLLWTAITCGLLESSFHIIIECICLGTGESAFYIAWVPFLCYGLLFLLSKIIHYIEHFIC